MNARYSQSGGLMLCRPSITLRPGQAITLISDLHIGSPKTDEKLVQKELALAKERGDRILINGDVFDAILASDSKRFRPNAVAPWLHGVNDIMGMALERAETLLSPYGDLIDMIGIGNHETKVEQCHSFCPVSALVNRLNNKTQQRILFGGYGGFVRYRVARTSKKKAGHRTTDPLTIFYWHGMGSGSSLSGALGEFDGKGSFVEGADVHWHAHKHVRLVCPVNRIYFPPVRSASLGLRTRWFVRTGAYMNAYKGQTQASWKETGRLGNYVADSLLQPANQGGLRLVLGEFGTRDLRVDFIV